MQYMQKLISIERLRFTNLIAVYSFHQLIIMSKAQYSLQLLQPMSTNRIQELSMVKHQSRLQENVNIVVAVWNLEGMLPPHNSIKLFVDSIIRNMAQPSPDLICIATQECQRSINMSLFCENKQQWENALKQSASGYKLVDTLTMRALHTALLVKQDIVNCYSTQKKEILRAGICNLFGNKGAISLVVNLLGQNFQFINCHLQAHQHSNNKRNQVLLRIADNLVEQDYRNQVFICGDLNYRIQMTHKQYHERVGTKVNTNEIMKYTDMFSKDQLTNQQILNAKFLPFFKQQQITFPPTYKIAQYGPQYNKDRIPGWTDRIFHRKGRAKQLNYKCLYDLFGTDHRPVLASYKVKTQQTLSIFPDQFVVVKKVDRGCALI